ncbi:unnamed protein product [Amaranthus hypochondriacus]
MGGGKKIWMPSTLVKMMHNSSQITDAGDEQKNENSCNTAADQQLSVTETASKQAETVAGYTKGDEEKWTPVSPNKIARRNYYKGACNTTDTIGTAAQFENDDLEGKESPEVEYEIDRDGNPLIPFL